MFIACHSALICLLFTANPQNAMIRLALYNRDVRKQNYILTPPVLAICIPPAIINSATITKLQEHICSKSKRRKSSRLKGASL